MRKTYEWHKRYAYLPTKVSPAKRIWLEEYWERIYWTEDDESKKYSRWMPFKAEIRVTERQEVGSGEAYIVQTRNVARDDFSQ